MCKVTVLHVYFYFSSFLIFTYVMDKFVVSPRFCPSVFFTTRGQNSSIYTILSMGCFSESGQIMWKSLILSRPKGPKPPNKTCWEPKLGPRLGPGPKRAAGPGPGPAQAALFGPGPGSGPNLGSKQILLRGRPEQNRTNTTGLSSSGKKHRWTQSYKYNSFVLEW